MMEINNPTDNSITVSALEKRLQSKGFKQERVKISELSQYYFDSIPSQYQHLTENLSYRSFRRLKIMLEELFEESNLTTYEKFMVILPTFNVTLREKYFDIVRKYNHIILDYNVAHFIDILACVCGLEAYVLNRLNNMFSHTRVRLRKFDGLDIFLRGVIIALDDSEIVLNYVGKVKCCVLDKPTGINLPLDGTEFRNNIMEMLSHLKQIKDKRKLLPTQGKTIKLNKEVEIGKQNSNNC